MPWCDECERYLTPTGTGGGGECPGCGRTIAASPDEAEARANDAEEDLKVPWHFKLLLVATAVYLAWRAVQGVSWLAAHM